ncbi:MAG: response regulator [Candidatus Eisenbacteria bacterium]
MDPRRYSPSEPPAPSHRPSTLESWRSSGLVLVVDDEPTVRDVAAELLEVMGLTPHACESGESAIAYFRQHASEVRMVLLDARMPGLDGEQTLRELQKLRPDVRVVLSSGLTDPGAAGEFIEGELAGFLRKPFELEEFADAVRAALESDATGL